MEGWILSSYLALSSLNESLEYYYTLSNWCLDMCVRELLMFIASVIVLFKINGLKASFFWPQIDRLWPVYVAIASMLYCLKLKVVRTPRDETRMLFHSDVLLSME
jgi:hypothetical protein